MTAMSLPIPVIETGRLILRAPHSSDLAAMTEFFATERSHFVGGPRDARGSFTSLTSRLGHWALHGFGLWHISTKDDREFAGWTGMIFAPGWQEPELGWALLEGFEGKGFATEAATAARDYAARHQGMNGVISHIAPTNHASLAVAQRLGAQFEAESELLGKPCQIWRHPKLGGQS